MQGRRTPSRIANRVVESNRRAAPSDTSRANRWRREERPRRRAKKESIPIRGSLRSNRRARRDVGSRWKLLRLRNQRVRDRSTWGTHVAHQVVSRKARRESAHIAGSTLEKPYRDGKNTSIGRSEQLRHSRFA